MKKIIYSSSKIAIVGAGIGGIALAILLKQRGFQNIRLFQKDCHFNDRRQGYGLTILQGKKVLKELNILQLVKKQNSPSKAHYIFNDKGQILGFHGTLFWDSLNQNKSLRMKEKGLSMHLPRQALRKIMLNRLQEVSNDTQNIEWNMKLTGLKLTQQNILLQFNKQSSQQFDLVVGCDGIYSSLRKYSVLNDNKLNYLNTLITLGICRSDHSLNKQRVFQTGNGSVRIFSMPFIKNDLQRNTMWQLSMLMEQERVLFYQKNILEAKQFLKNLCKNWHQPIPSLIDNTSTQNFMSIAAYDRDTLDQKQVDSRIFLLGDALHPMSPFKGQGANQALLDASYLSSIMKNSQINDLHRQYYQHTNSRVSEKVLQSRKRVDKYHQPEYLNIQKYLYPQINRQLIDILRANKVNSESGEEIEQQIIKLMSVNKYLN